MVSDSQVEVWQDGRKDGSFIMMKIQSRYCDDPMFTLAQERAIHEMVRSFLLVNRQDRAQKAVCRKEKSGEEDEQ